MFEGETTLKAAEAHECVADVLPSHECVAEEDMAIAEDEAVIAFAAMPL